MPCYKPLRAWRTDDGDIVFAERGRIHSSVTLACGQCIGCRLERSRQWAMRCMHEAKMHRFNSFLTLTYDDEHLPDRYWTGLHRRDGTKAYAGNLHYPDVQRFLKRLRKALGKEWISSDTRLTTTRGGDSRYGASPHAPYIKFYAGAEYGEQYWRPHYHLCVFNARFNDQKYLGRSPTGKTLWRSPTLEQLWPMGFSSIGEVNFESAAYVARYVMKKITGQQAERHYEKLDYDTGEIIKLTPEFNQMSRDGGIGLSWLDKYTADVYGTGKAKVVVRGKETNPPRYYDKIYKQRFPTQWEAIEYDRYIEGRKHAADQLPHRLKAKEEVAAAKISQLKRKL